jgi:hypothetical protein
MPSSTMHNVNSNRRELPMFHEIQRIMIINRRLKLVKINFIILQQRLILIHLGLHQHNGWEIFNKHFVDKTSNAVDCKI